MDRGQALAERLKSRDFRTALKLANIENGIAFQLIAMMGLRGWNQRELARRSGIAQPLISKYLRGYENYTVYTLDKLADAFDVSLVVRFEPYSQLLEYHNNMNSESLAVPSYSEDAEREQARGP